MSRHAPKASPKSMLLDLLRVTPGREIPVRQLVAAAALLGFSGNASRVALARLQARGLVESTERGAYRLAPLTDPVSRHVDSWRLGESRLRPWDRSWLCVHLPKAASRTARAKSVKALSFLGLREGLPGLWVRPGNLEYGIQELRPLLAAMGLEAAAQIFIASDFSAPLLHTWQSRLWNVEQIGAAGRKALEALQESDGRVGRLAAGAALRETFLTGGAAIRALVLDPLLPEEIAPGEARRKLTLAMLRYDALGRDLWGRFLGNSGIGEAPRHLAGLASVPTA